MNFISFFVSGVCLKFYSLSQYQWRVPVGALRVCGGDDRDGSFHPDLLSQHRDKWTRTCRGELFVVVCFDVLYGECIVCFIISNLSTTCINSG